MIGLPSKNIRINADFEAVSRQGYLAMSWDLAEANKPAKSLYVEQYNVTFFSINGKVKVIDHENSHRVTDTGISLTATETTTFGEYAGDVYCTNPTDGLRQFHVGRVNQSNATAGDAKITLDQDLVARLLAFSDTTGTLGIGTATPSTEAYAITLTGNVSGTANNGVGLIRITTSAAHTMQTGCTVVLASVGGTTEANGTWVVTKVDATNFDLQGSTFASNWTSGGTWTYSNNGVFPITGTLNADVPDNTLVYTVEDISSGKPKGSKIVFWKERMIIIGVPSATDTDNATQIAFMSQFVSGRDLQKLIVFGITGEATEEWIGEGGSLKNIVSTRDYLYYFKEGETYFSSVADVSTTTGATFPQLLSNNYGCVNENCAVDLGSGLIAYLTKNKRVMGIRTSTISGAATVFPDETFDQPIRNTLELLDEDQSGSIMFYHKGKKLLYVQCSVDNNIITLIYDNNIGKWLPPDDNKVFSSYFEKDGVLYATKSDDDTIFEMDNGEKDDGMTTEYVIGLPVIEFQNGRTMMEIREIHLSGGISETGEIQVENIVNEGTPQIKTIDTTGLSFGPLASLGTVTLGTTVLGVGVSTPLAGWDRRYSVYPRIASRFQCVLSSSNAFSLSSYLLVATALPRPVLTLS